MVSTVERHKETLAGALQELQRRVLVPPQWSIGQPLCVHVHCVTVHTLMCAHVLGMACAEDRRDIGSPWLTEPSPWHFGEGRSSHPRGRARVCHYLCGPMHCLPRSWRSYNTSLKLPSSSQGHDSRPELCPQVSLKPEPGQLPVLCSRADEEPRGHDD